MISLESIRGGLIVSCQAVPRTPLSKPTVLSLMAVSVVGAGAVAVRAEGLDNIRAIRGAVAVPVVGLIKVGSNGPYITPTLEDALAIAAAGAEIIAIDATLRPRRDGRRLEEIIATIHAETGCLVMADISTLEEGIVAVGSGADLVATTLSGYTPYTTGNGRPDRKLVRELSSRVQVPVVAEGRIGTPRQAREAIEAGAFAVVVGTAITDPGAIATRFLEEMRANRFAAATPPRAKGHEGDGS